MQQLRAFLAPKWLAGHLIVLAVSVTMVLLGRWQLDVSNSKHFDLQNFGYALQWWTFTAFGLLMWARVLRDVVRRDREPVGSGPPEEAPVAYRRYLMPQSKDAPAIAADGEHAAYNDYLAQLARSDAEPGATA